MAVSKCSIQSISSDVERCLSMVRHCSNIFFLLQFDYMIILIFILQCLEERLRGLVSNLIRLSKQVMLDCFAGLSCFHIPFTDLFVYVCRGLILK